MSGNSPSAAIMTPAENPKPRVCVLVVNWNGKEHLRRCLPSLLSQDYGAHDVWVLDNASTDGSADMVRHEFPSLLILKNEKNLGFTGAGNIGLSRAREQKYDYVVVLANDVVMDPRCLSVAVAAAQADPMAGMIGFQMIGATSYAPFEEFEKAARDWLEPDVQPTEWVEGAAYLADPALIERLGGYDEVLFMYGDENDLETRLVRAGYRLLKTNIPVWHNAGRNVMGELRLRSAYFTFRNTLILLTKHERWRDVLRRALQLVRLSCDPFMAVSGDNIVLRRYRPSNVLANGLVVLCALLSYSLNLRKVLRTRRKHRELIDQERRLLAARGDGQLEWPLRGGGVS